MKRNENMGTVVICITFSFTKLYLHLMTRTFSAQKKCGMSFVPGVPFASGKWCRKWFSVKKPDLGSHNLPLQNRMIRFQWHSLNAATRMNAIIGGKKYILCSSEFRDKFEEWHFFSTDTFQWTMKNSWA